MFVCHIFSTGKKSISFSLHHLHFGLDLDLKQAPAMLENHETKIGLYYVLSKVLLRINEKEVGTLRNRDR